MNNPWKLATIGLVLTSVTAMATGLTTAYVLRPPTAAQADTISPSTTPAAPTTRYTVTPAVVQQAPAPVATTGRVVPVSTQRVATTDCSTGTQRALKIAKPGGIGALVGAGLGAAGGAIANGGKAAGKGALIGGIAGAALGAGYGAYKTKNECGTIFGNAFSGGPSYAVASHAPATQSAFTPASTSGANQIQVYRAR